MSLLTSWLEIPNGIDPDWTAAFAALDTMSDEDCEVIVMEALQLEVEDLADAGPAYFRDKLRNSVLFTREAWEGGCPTVAILETTTGKILLVCQPISEDGDIAEDPEDPCTSLNLFLDSGLHETAGFGSMSDHVVATSRMAAAQFIRSSCEKFQFTDNEQVLALAGDVEAGKEKP